MGASRYEPTDGLSYNPNEDRYWDRDALSKEIARVFEVCHGCRLCFKFCPSFPTLFDAVDANDGDVTKVGPGTTDTVVDQCFQCQLCYVNCPYTPGDDHEFQLDFPKLMLRAKAIRVKERGLPFRERVLRDPVRLGNLAKGAAGLANWGNRVRPLRLIMEKTLGIHRDKQLPEFHGETFEEWFRRKAPEGSGDTGRVALFSSCFVNYNGPQIGKDVVEVLARNGVAMQIAGASCCGMPAIDAGDVAFAQEQARRNVEELYPLVEQGLPIVVINPSCSLMLRREYPQLLAPPGDAALYEKAKAVSEHTADVCEFVFGLHRAKKFDRGFRSSPTAIAYHVPCHLKPQNIGIRARDLMKLLPECKIRVVSECCGHDGTWAMKAEHYDDSIKTGRRAFEGLQGREAEVWATDCPLAAIQIEQHAGRGALHPLQIIARAYREDGFSQHVDEQANGDE